MHPEIALFPSTQFYQGGLLNGEVRQRTELQLLQPAVLLLLLLRPLLQHAGPFC
jgi:hypothetical protein